jgi:hypothetical protein
MPTLTTDRPSLRTHASRPAVTRKTENARDFRLGDRIRERIYLRLGWRICDLDVQVDGQQVVLYGRCATYYSKQLAQHVALGLVEDERLINEIVVAGQS